MARATLSALLSNLEGRFGGGVFRNWKGLIVLSALPESVANPNTQLQAKARSLLSVVSKAWAALSTAERAGWASVADYLTRQWENFSNEVGINSVIKTPRGPFPPLGALTSAHTLLGSCGLWDTDDSLIAAPVGVTAPSAPTDLEASGDTDGIVLTWSTPDTWGDNASAGKVRVWARSEDGTFFAQLVTSVAPAETYTITRLRLTGSGDLNDLLPGRYFIQLDAVNAEGFRSAPSAIAALSIAEPV